MRKVELVMAHLYKLLVTYKLYVLSLILLFVVLICGLLYYYSTRSNEYDYVMTLLNTAQDTFTPQHELERVARYLTNEAAITNLSDSKRHALVEAVFGYTNRVKS